MFVVFKERTGSNTFDHNNLTLQYKLDNEFELIFVVAYQKILQLSYIDKFLSDVHLEFRDKYKNELNGGVARSFVNYNFVNEYNNILSESEQWGKLQATMPKKMRSFNDSVKSKKTVASMIERKGDEKDVKKSVKIVDIKEDIVEKDDDQFEKEDQILANRKKLAEKLSKKKVDTK